jgi:hypothetical protein
VLEQEPRDDDRCAVHLDDIEDPLLLGLAEEADEAEQIDALVGCIRVQLVGHDHGAAGRERVVRPDGSGRHLSQQLVAALEFGSQHAQGPGEGQDGAREASPVRTGRHTLL